MTLPDTLWDLLAELSAVRGISKVRLLRSYLKRTKLKRYSKTFAVVLRVAAPAAFALRPLVLLQVTATFRVLNKQYALNLTDLQAQGVTTWVFANIPLLQALLGEATNGDDFDKKQWDALFSIFTTDQINKVVNLAIR